MNFVFNHKGREVFRNECGVTCQSERSRRQPQGSQSFAQRKVFMGQIGHWTISIIHRTFSIIHYSPPRHEGTKLFLNYALD